MNKYRLILYILILTNQLFGQYVVNDPIIPELSPFSKIQIGDINYYNGKPNISIELFDLKLKSKSIHLALNYQTGGIKVNSEASRFGLGWTLSHPVIYRKINGNDDHNRDNAPSNSWHRTNKSRLTNDSELTSFEIATELERLLDYNTIKSASGSHGSGFSEDTEPDEYIYSIPGETSGSFYIDKYGDIIKKELNNYKIEWSSDIPSQNGISSKTIGVIMSITITSPEGIIYIFDVKDLIEEPSISEKLEWPIFYEYWLSRDYNVSGSSSITSYHISKIINENSSIEYEYITYKTKKVIKGSSRNIFATALDKVYASNKYIHSNYLSKITTNETNINFIEGLSREDQYDPLKSIDRIEIFNNFNNKLFKTIKFNTSYFQSEGYSQQDATSKFSYLRLKLDNIEESNNDRLLNKYSFNYNKTLLPYKDSYELDLWGFYKDNNNILSNLDAYPTIYYHPEETGWKRYSPFQLNSSDYIGNEIIFNGANRSSNIEGTKACVLEEIKYKLGGSKKFEWELNTFKVGQSIIKGAGLRIKSITLIDDNKSILKKNYKYVNNQSESTGKIFSLPTIVFPGLDNKPFRYYGETTSNTWRGRAIEKNYFNSYSPAWFIIISNNNSGEIYTRNGIVGYSQVTEILENSKIVRYYSTRGHIDDNIDQIDNSLLESKIGNIIYSRPKTNFINGLKNWNDDNFSNFITDLKPSLYQLNNGQLNKNYELDGHLIMEEYLNFLDKTVRIKKIEYELIENEPKSFLGINIGLISSNANQNWGISVGAIAEGALSQSGHSKHISVGGVIDILNNSIDSGPQIYFPIPEILNYTIYNIKNNYKLVVSKITTIENGIESTEENTYNPKFEGDLPIEVIKTNSDGNVLKHKILYSNSNIYPSKNKPTDGELMYYERSNIEIVSVNSLLLARNIITPLEETTYLNNNVINSKFFEYKLYEDSFGRSENINKNYPILHKVHEINVDKRDFIPFSINGLNDYNFDDRYELKATYNYDIYWNLNEVLTDYGIISYLYSYPLDEKSYIYSQKHYVDTRVSAIVKNANVSDISFTSFENGKALIETLVLFDGWFVDFEDGISRISKTNYMTGNTSFKGYVYRDDINLTGKYVFSFFSKGTDLVYVNGANVAGSNSSEWKYNEIILDNPTELNVSSGNTWIDELRFYPVGAQMTTYTYKPLVGITSITDPRGEVVRYEYDEFGRLKYIKDKDGNILKANKYNYRQN